jgi:hypothetical protein
MHNQYMPPSVVVYDRDAVLELLGPVKTQYAPPPSAPPLSCSSVEVNPVSILRNKEEDVTVSILTSGSGSFSQVEISVPNSVPLMFYQFNKADGTMVGNQWTITLPDFIQEEPGAYEIVITLLGASSGPTTCSGTISID